MDFATLPPEINSALLYAGPGSGPMLQAATAWENLAGEMYSAASSYASVAAGLADGGWRGPSSVSMAAAAANYVAWLNTTAAQAQQSAAQAEAAASAFETAFAAVVPPPVIAANRSQLAMLIATNFLGINAPAIMATEAQYAEMWAQDAAVMYGYAASSAAAATLSPFSPPQQNTNPAGLAAQSAAVTNSDGRKPRRRVASPNRFSATSTTRWRLTPSTRGSAPSQRSPLSSCPRTPPFRPGRVQRRPLPTRQWRH